MSPLGQLITGQNDFCLAADGGFSIHDSNDGNGNGNGDGDGDGDGGGVDVDVAAGWTDRFFEYAIVVPWHDVLRDTTVCERHI